MLAGILLVEILKPLILENPAYLAGFLIFIFMSTTIVVFQIEETLPSKEELEWKTSIQSIFITYKSGETLFNQNLRKEKNENQDNNEVLLRGALSAIRSIITEIGQNQKPISIIEQEKFSILLEEGENIIIALISIKDLKILRKKMKEFLKEFQEFFGELLKEKTAEIEVFLPTKKLITKYFN